VSRLVPRADLTLGMLTGPGPGAIGATRPDLFGPAAFYPVTAAWATAIRDGTPDTQGLVWMSLQDDTARALMLWADRLADDVLEVVGPPEPIDRGPGLQRVEAFARDARITLV